MRPYDKPACTLAQQLQLLRERGIDVANPEAALVALQQVSYYRLSGYCLPFKRSDQQYTPGAAFETVLSLYEMDRRLRLTLLDAIERVEVAVRCAVSNTFALRY